MMAHAHSLLTQQPSTSATCPSNLSFCVQGQEVLKLGHSIYAACQGNIFND